MSYYTSVLETFEISNFNTFEDLKKRYPNKSSTYLKKIIYLRGFKICKNGKIKNILKEKVTQKIKSRSLKSSCNIDKLEIPIKKEKQMLLKTNCPQCHKEVFLVFSNNTFCSKKCKQEYWKKHKTNGMVKAKGTTEQSLKNYRCPECWSVKLVWVGKYTKIMCNDCGFVNRIKF